MRFQTAARWAPCWIETGLGPPVIPSPVRAWWFFASEAGVLEIAPEDILEKGALGPGRMILVDFEKKRVLQNGEIKNLNARRQPYRRWVEENRISLRGFYGEVASIKPDHKRLPFQQKLFGYTREDLQMIMAPMATTGQEPVGAMGADTPLAVFSEKNQLLFGYFKQLFAQVTNPPIDPVREELVMSLMTFIGNPGNILAETPRNSRLIKLLHPIMTNEDLIRLSDLNVEGFRAETVKIGFPVEGDGVMLETALERICNESESAVTKGHQLIILSDRDLPEGTAPIPSLLAVSAVNQHLVGRGIRTSAGLIVETGEAREVMHVALLLGYGATAVNPYLAFEIVAAMAVRKTLDRDLGTALSIENYIKALCKGLLKIMSKMGISTLRSYRSAQVFEAVGLNKKLVDRYFNGTDSRIEGIGLDEIAQEAVDRYHSAYHPPSDVPRILPSGGHFSVRVDGERHLWTPEAIYHLQRAARENDATLYARYADSINDQSEKQSTLRGNVRLPESGSRTP